MNNIEKTILVTGATSQIGDYLLPRLVNLDCKVVLLSRQQLNQDKYPQHWQLLQYDLQTDINLADKVNYPITTVMHLATLPLIKPLLTQLSSQSLKRIIAFSSTSAIVKQISTNIAEQQLAAELIDAEKTIMNTNGIVWTIFRPTLIYGCGRDKTVSVIEKFIKRYGFFLVPGKGNGLRQPVHADDLAAACIQVLNETQAYGRIYNLSGGQTLSYRAMIQTVFAKLDKKPLIVSLPNKFLSLLLCGIRAFPKYRYLNSEMLNRVDIDLVFDHATAASDFNYSPRVFIP